jgi:hypothetical protein
MAVARKRWSSTARLRIFLANDGRCHVCGQKISVGEGLGSGPPDRARPRRR